jgi:hypothetical protein
MDRNISLQSLALELCRNIEKLPASEQQTLISIKAAELHRKLTKLNDEQGNNSHCAEIIAIVAQDLKSRGALYQSLKLACISLRNEGELQ